MQEAHKQNLQKLNVWAGTMGNYVFRKFFIEGNLIGKIHLNILYNNIVPTIVQGKFKLVFQPGLCPNPSHYNMQVRNILHHQFPGVWTGRLSALEWPAHLLHITPITFFFFFMGVLQNYCS